MTSIKYSLLLLLFAVQLQAQQNSLFNTYNYDPLQLNIAYSAEDKMEANLHYRAQWIGLKETPKVIQLNGYTTFGSSNAAVLRVNSQTAGLYNLTGITLGYSYFFNVNTDSKIHLGIGAGFNRATLRSKDAIVIDANDLALNSGNLQAANGFDSEFGALFIGKKIKAGISALHLYNSNPDFAGKNSYKALPQLNTMVSYVFKKDKNLEFEPVLLSRNTIGGNNVFEGIFNVNFLKDFKAGIGYRTNYGVLVIFGANIKKLKVAYSFDYGTNKNASAIGSSHQIMIGFITERKKSGRRMAQTMF